MTTEEQLTKLRQLIAEALVLTEEIPKEVIVHGTVTVHDIFQTLIDLSIDLN